MASSNSACLLVAAALAASCGVSPSVAVRQAMGTLAETPTSTRDLRPEVPCESQGLVAASSGALFLPVTGRVVAVSNGSRRITKASFWVRGLDGPVRLDAKYGPDGAFNVFLGLATDSATRCIDGVRQNSVTTGSAQIVIDVPGCRPAVVNVTEAWKARDIDVECDAA
jgi:hypothetical protein